MTVFLFSLAGNPPLAGAWAKIFVFRAVLDSGTASAIALGVVAAVNAVIAIFYYANVARLMWMSPVADGDPTPTPVPPPLQPPPALTVTLVAFTALYPHPF